MDGSNGKASEVVKEEDVGLACEAYNNLRPSETVPVQNPFSSTPNEILVRAASEFATTHQLAEYDVWFRKGALVAKFPNHFDHLEELDESDREVLGKERDRKWRLPRALWATVIICSVGAAVQGWDQTGSNGANLTFPKDFGIGSDSRGDKLLVGLINTVPNFAMMAIGCWLSEPANNFLGRRGAIFISAVFAFASVLGSAFTQSWEQLIVCRIILGIGMGIKSSTTAIFCAESVPAQIRGSLVMSWQLWVAFGIFLGFSANLTVVDTGAIAWRLQLGSAFIPAVPLMAFVFLCPESPRWYVKKGRYADAFASLRRLRHSPLQAARDLYLMHVQVQQESTENQRSGTGIQRFGQLFTVPRLRRATLAASIVMLAQQMCGINIIAFYSSTVFVESGTTERTAIWASWGFGLINFIFALPALKTIDTFGRRALLLSTFPHMAWSLLAAGLCYLVPGDGTARLAALALFIYLFAIFYSPGMGPVCYVYAAEVLPLSHREIGMAWAVTVNAAGATVLGLTFPYMLVALTPTGAFGLYCGLNVLAFLLIFLWVPETRQYSLEELDHVFCITTSDFSLYQCKKVLPWYFNRFIRQQRNVPLEPLKGA